MTAPDPAAPTTDPATTVPDPATATDGPASPPSPSACPPRSTSSSRWAVRARTASTTWRTSSSRSACTTRSPRRRRRAADHRRRHRRRRGAAGRQQPGRPRRPSRWPTAAALDPATSTCTSPRTSRSPAAWPAAAPTPPPRCWPATRCGAPAPPGKNCWRSAPSWAATCRSAWSAARRWAADAANCSTPLGVDGTFHWVFAVADGGLSTPAVYRECDRLRAASGTGCTVDDVPAPQPDPALLARLRDGDAVALAAAARQRPPGRRASRCAPRWRTPCGPAPRRGALAALVSGSGPTCAFLVKDAGVRRGTSPTP